MKQLTEAAAEARRAYFREYRARNRERLNERRRAWYAANKAKAAAQQERYWSRRAADAAKPEDPAE